jgi:hypothetical protein
MKTTCALEFSTFWYNVDVSFEGPSVVSVKRVICARDPAVETYVRRSNLAFEIFVLNEVGGQVKDVCGGSAYDVISLDEDI